MFFWLQVGQFLLFAASSISYHFFQIKWLTVQLALVSTRHSIRQSLAVGKSRLKTKVSRAAKWTKGTKKKVGRAAKDLIIPSIPGVSKVRLPVPPAPHLLRSNEPPTDDQIVLIRKAIVDAEEELNRLEDIFETRMIAGNASRAWETVTRHKMGQTKRFIRQHKGIISSIRLLPPEILQEIFAWIAPSFQQVHARWRWNSDLPWGLGQVCRRWRINILSMSSFWGHLPTIHLKNSRAKTNLQVQYLTELIRRSRGAPLEMYIYARSFNRNKHPVIDLLCQHSDQWEAVTMELAPATITGFQAIKGRLSSLKILILQAHSTVHHEENSLDIFQIAPKLHTVSVSGILLSGVQLPFEQLVHYKERVVWGDRLSKVVMSPLLETLTALEISDDVVFPSITIPLLKKLQVKFYYRAQRTCFDNVILPSIEEIRIVSHRGNLIPSLTLMLSKSGSPCPLKSLFIRSEFVGHYELTNLLALTPLLTHLDITLPSSNADIYNLADGHQNRALAPMLEICHFYLEDVVGADVSAAMNRLASRRCELVTDEENGDLVLPGEMRPIKELSIYFDSSEWAHMQQASLESWSDSPTASTLRTARMRLHEKMPELDYGRPGRQKVFDLRWHDKVPQLLAHVENVNVTDVNDIYVSHQTLLSQKLTLIVCIALSDSILSENTVRIEN